MKSTLTKMKLALDDYSAKCSDFEFELIELQRPGEGIVAREVIHDEHESYFGADAHATQFFAILVTSTRTSQRGATDFEQIKLEAYE